MKKFLSFVVSAATAVSSIPFLTASAAGEQSVDNVVIFGDSIAAGYGLDEKTEYNYGQIISDYLGADVYNLAHSGDTTADLLAKLDGLSDSEKKELADTDVVVISIGGNDLMHYASKKIVDFIKKNSRADKNGEWKWFNDGFTAADIPDDPSITDLMRIVNLQGEGGLVDFAKANPTKLNTLLQNDISANLRISDDEGHEGYIPNVIIPNIKTATEKIKAVNPDARIIVQTIYQPLQLDPAYTAPIGGMTEKMALNLVRTCFEDILLEFKKDLSNISGIEIADVYKLFTALDDSEEQTLQNPGYCYYFTSMQSSGADRDFHPNQRGHLAIATSVLDTIGVYRMDKANDGLLTKIYNYLPDDGRKVIYPPLAFETFKKVAGDYSVLKGDTDFDGIVDASDATNVLAEATLLSSGGNGTFSGVQKQVANVDNSDIVDASDATYILSYATYSSAGGKDSLEKFLGF